MENQQALNLHNYLRYFHLPGKPIIVPRQFVTTDTRSPYRITSRKTAFSNMGKRDWPEIDHISKHIQFGHMCWSTVCRSLGKARRNTASHRQTISIVHIKSSTTSHGTPVYHSFCTYCTNLHNQRMMCIHYTRYKTTT